MLKFVLIKLFTSFSFLCNLCSKSFLSKGADGDNFNIGVVNYLDRNKNKFSEITTFSRTIKSYYICYANGVPPLPLISKAPAGQLKSFSASFIDALSPFF